MKKPIFFFPLHEKFSLNSGMTVAQIFFFFLKDIFSDALCFHAEHLEKDESDFFKEASAFFTLMQSSFEGFCYCTEEGICVGLHRPFVLS